MSAASDNAAVMAHRDMIIALRDRVSKLVQQGKTQAEVVAAKPTADYDAKVPGADGVARRREHDGEHQLQCAPQALQRFGAKLAVRRHPGRDQWVGNLQQ